MQQLDSSPSWQVNANCTSSNSQFKWELWAWTRDCAIKILDEDVTYTLSMWIKDPEFLGRIFTKQADRLGYTIQEKKSIFSRISRKDMTHTISFQTHNSWHEPWNISKLWAVIFGKLPKTIENSSDLIDAYLHTPGIIEIYPGRADETMHVFSILNHEINHLLMTILYIYRNQQKNIPLEETIEKVVSPIFQSVTETLAWLDGGQVPGMETINHEHVDRYVWWQEWGKYDGLDTYEMAKLRSYRIHVLQIKIHNLPNTSAIQYQNWCKKIREIVFAWIDQPEYLTLIDEYLNWVSSPEQARDQLLALH
jgi:hypothetical protein